MSPRSHSGRARALALDVACNTAGGPPLGAPGLTSCSSDLSYPSLALQLASLIKFCMASQRRTEVKGKAPQSLFTCQLIHVNEALSEQPTPSHTLPPSAGGTAGRQWFWIFPFQVVRESDRSWRQMGSVSPWHMQFLWLSFGLH